MALQMPENPPIRAPRLSSVVDAGAPWWLAHTRSRMEKAFVRDLIYLGIEYFFPLVSRIRYSGGRKRRWLIPLFSGYVFYSGNEQARYQCMCTGRLCQTIQVTDQETLVCELRAIEAAMENGFTLAPAKTATVGQRCRVKSGPLKGVEGHTVRIDDRSMILLSVQMLGQGGLVEIEADLLEPIEHVSA